MFRNMRVRRLLLVVFTAALAVPPSAGAAQPVFIGDMFHEHAQHPRTLGLWASDGLVKLHWTGWGSATARATGKVTTHEQGVYRYTPARVIASRVRTCNGRQMYTRLRYHAFGAWHQAVLDDCSFGA